MDYPIDFQTIILRLQSFWAEHGCLIWQPYHTEVGAGTMNPATFLRVLGPEPWNVAYVEPSIRPDDARYGQNPNRMQQHYQYQVILKPDPGNPQELYLQSLQTLGLNPRQHDIRFVEDNWESPALGAWGLGWQVWLDGQEITQFTYFQQAGGIVLDPVAVEITYGLERIAMAIMGIHDFRHIPWNENFTYGDVKLQAEQEYSAYFIELADVDRLRQTYATFKHEAEACLGRGLVLPALDHVLKCSHLFNILDTRGAVGVAERQALFGDMRDLSRRVAEAYLAQRQEMGYPWLDKAPARRPSAEIGSTSSPEATKIPLVQNNDDLAQAARPLLVEIGVEELPPDDLETALAQLSERLPTLLAELRLTYPEGSIKVMGTPRRLVIYLPELTARQNDLEQVIKGPPADRAFDTVGKPTQVAEGFARSKGATVGDLQVREMNGGKYACAVVKQVGRPTLEVLAAALPDLIASLRFARSMRWNQTNVAFSRPIRWLLALYGEQVLSFEYAGLQASNCTRGLRFYPPEEFSVGSPQEYFAALEAQGIILDVVERRARIRAQMEAAAAKLGGALPEDLALLAQIANEVEVPTVLSGSFDPAFLELPHEVLTAVMKKHQKYFPVISQESGKSSADSATLLPYFLALRNGDEHGLDIIARGNADVIHARFADAAFFIAEDKKLSLPDYLPRLETLTFQKDLGSMLDKTRRLVALVDTLAVTLGLDIEQTQIARRAAELSKADLVTKMVVEMTSLQGIMGRYYARLCGEPEAVATAIYEHHLPRFSGDALPQTRPGLLLSVADRLDTLVGLFSVGLAPTSTRDPFALRRAALGLVQSLMTLNVDFNLDEAIQAVARFLPAYPQPDRLAECSEFIKERLRNALLEQGYRYDVVEAVCLAQGQNPAGALRGVKELTVWVERDDWRTILPAYARCARILRSAAEATTEHAAEVQRYEVLPQAFQEPAEIELHRAIEAALRVERRRGSVDDFLNTFVPMVAIINRFFDQVLVMSEDPIQRANRLGMLQRIVSLAEGVADLSCLEGF